MPVIASNTAANSALVYLNRNSREQDKSLSKISSGSRIVVASDDAAGLAVGSRLKADVTTLKSASNNITQAQSVLKVADAGLSRIGDILQRMKALATQATSGSVDTTAAGFLQDEYDQLQAEIDGVATNVEFNGQNLLDGSFDANVGIFQVGVSATDTIVADLNTVDAQATGIGLNANNLADPTNAAATSAEIDTAIDNISTYRALVGSYMSRFEFRGDYVASAIESLSAATSSIMDVDIASEQSNLTSKQVLTEASIAALAQANQMKSSLLSLVR